MTAVVVIADDGRRRVPRAVTGLADSIEQGIRTIRVSYRADSTQIATLGYVRGVLAALSRLRREGWP